MITKTIAEGEQNLKRTLLEKGQPWFNPYFVKGRELRNIIFFRADGTTVEVGRGWFGSNNVRGTFAIDGECLNKHKPDFKLTQPFLIPVPLKYSTERRNHEKHGILYIPLGKDWKATVKKREEPSRTERWEVWTNKNWGVDFTRYLPSIQKEDVLADVALIKAKLVKIHKLSMWGKPTDDLSDTKIAENRKELLALLGSIKVKRPLYPCVECGELLGLTDSKNESFKTCRTCGVPLCEPCWETKHVHLKGVKGEPLVEVAKEERND